MLTTSLMRFYPIMLLLAGAVVSFATRAEAPVDCPLRDAPFSLNSPLMDIMLNEQASAMTNRHLDGAIDKLPPIFASAEAPSFSAILNLRLLAGMGGLDAALLEPLGAELATLPVTDADRAARCRRYDNRSPELRIPEGHPRVLVFEKMTGYRDGPSVEAAAAAMQQLASRHGWALVSTDAGGAITPQVLAQFDVVVWNNVSGDVLTLSQRQAFEDYINNGGGYVGMHGSAGDPLYFWDWYVDTLIGARFTGHPMDPQFQDARINLEANAAHIGDGLGDGWTMNDEWYSFKTSARASGSTVIATLDESTYSQNGRWGQNVSMGNDHPIVWTRNVGKGRAFYSAIGHRPETYSDERHLTLLEQGIEWAAGNH